MTEEKNKYFDMRDAYDDVRFESGGTRKALAATKLVGKGLFNTARYFLTESLPKQIERMEEKRKTK